MYIVCSDLESIFTPETWLHIAERTKIKELQLTTRDVPNFEALTNKRLKILKSHKIKFVDIQKIIKDMKPLEGAIDFLNWLRKRCQVIILSDTFSEFVNPLIEKLSYPTIFCHSLKIGKDGFIKNYILRQKDSKRKSVKSLKLLDFKVIAIGDSYNDINMLKEADIGIFFKPSKDMKKKFTQFPVAQGYKELKSKLKKYI